MPPNDDRSQIDQAMEMFREAHVVAIGLVGAVRTVIDSMRYWMATAQRVEAELREVQKALAVYQKHDGGRS